MTLASRLGTAFHLGHISTGPLHQNEIIQSNLGVVQIQAFVVSVLSVFLVELKHTISEGFEMQRMFITSYSCLF